MARGRPQDPKAAPDTPAPALDELTAKPAGTAAATVHRLDANTTTSAPASTEPTRSTGQANSLAHKIIASPPRPDQDTSARLGFDMAASASGLTSTIAQGTLSQLYAQSTQPAATVSWAA
jgi:hypothetical protein